MNTLEVLTLVLAIFTAIAYIDSHQNKKQLFSQLGTAYQYTEKRMVTGSLIEWIYLQSDKMVPIGAQTNKKGCGR